MICSTVTIANLCQLVPMINAAYRGQASRHGWTTEADLIGGEKRTDLGQLQALMQEPGATILKATDDDGRICGCVFLRNDGEKGLYLGMLCVWPGMQDAGIGRLLLTASEAQARQLGLGRIYMQVIDSRSELIAWYERRGYSDSGERRPFIVPEEYGKPLVPVEFIILAKSIEAQTEN